MSKKPAKSEPAPTPAPAEPPPVLGVVPKGVLKEIRLKSITDPEGEPDRLPRPGDADRIAETARSLREVGQLQPIMVEEVGDEEYVRVFGRRRLAAARLNQELDGGWRDTIMAIVVPRLAPDVRRTIVAVENIQRQDLTPAEEHLAVAELLELQAFEAAIQLGVPAPVGMDIGRPMTREIADRLVNRANAEMTKKNARLLLQDHKVRARACDIVAAMLAKAPTWVRDRMYVGRLDDKARAAMLQDKLPLMHAREIAKVADPDLRSELAISFAAGGEDSVSDVEAGEFEKLRRAVGENLLSLKVIPWRLDVPFASQPACDGCQHNSIAQPGLFDHGGEVSAKMVGGRGVWSKEATPADLGAGVCTKPSCYAIKLRASKAAVAAAAKRIVDGGRKKQDAKVPEFVAEKELEAKVRGRREMRGGAKRSSKAAASAAQRDRDEQLRKAKWKFDEAVSEHSRKLAAKGVAAAKGDAGVLVRIVINALGTRKLTPEFASRIKLAGAGDFKAIKGIKIWDPSLWDVDAQCAETIAKACGVEITPAPKWEDFKPKAPEKTPAPKPAAVSKPSGGSKAARSTKPSGKKASKAPKPTKPKASAAIDPEDVEHEAAMGPGGDE